MPREDVELRGQIAFQLEQVCGMWSSFEQHPTLDIQPPTSNGEGTVFFAGAGWWLPVHSTARLPTVVGLAQRHKGTKVAEWGSFSFSLWMLFAYLDLKMKLLSYAGIALFSSAIGFAQTDEKGKMPTVDEIREKGMMGQLGKPIGSIVKIKAIALKEGGAKGDHQRQYLEVQEVFGKALEKPLVMELRQLYGEFKRIPAGNPIEGYVFESAAYEGIPDDTYRVTDPPAGRGFSLASYLVWLAPKVQNPDKK
jgi:hypothetical protein